MESGTKQAHLPSWLRTVLIGRNPRRTLARIGVMIVAVLLIRAYALIPITVKGPSMLPTYEERGVNFVNRLAYLHSDPQRGDVVAIRTSGTSIMYMKRVVGLPGETVAFHKGHLLINGKVLDEPYVKLACDWERAPVTLGDHQYFVVGDNRSMPEQYHVFGETDRVRIVGKILLCKNLFASFLSRF